MKADIIPKRATTGSAGYDFYAPADIDIIPGQWIRFGTGVRFDGTEKVYTPLPAKQPVRQWVMLIMPRSSYGMRYRMRFANTVCVIDSDYRDEIMVEITSDIPFTIKKGERYAQGIIVPYGVFSDEIVPTEERTGGIGSTGV